MGGKTKTTTNSTTTNPYAVQSYNSAVSQLGKSQYSPLTGEQISSYMSPYTSNVIDAVTKQSNQNQDLALNQNRDSAIRAGAFDTSGLDVENALTRGQFDMNNQSTISQLMNQNYGQALSTAQGENGAQNQYPLAIQALLGQLAQGTTQTTNGTQTKKAPTDWAGIIKSIGSAASTVAAL